MLTQVGLLALLASTAIAAPVAQQQGYDAMPVAAGPPSAGAPPTSAGAPPMQMSQMYGDASLKEPEATTPGDEAPSTEGAAPKDGAQPAPLGTSPMPEPGAGDQPLCGTEPYDPNAYTCSPLKAKGPTPPGVPANAALTNGHILCMKPYKACGYDCYQEGTLYGCTEDGTTLYQLPQGSPNAGAGQPAGGPALIPSGEKVEEIQAPPSAPGTPPAPGAPGSPMSPEDLAMLEQYYSQASQGPAQPVAPGATYGAQGGDAAPPYPLGPDATTPGQVPGAAMPSGAVQLTPEMISTLYGSSPDAGNSMGGSTEGPATPGAPPAQKPDESPDAAKEPAFPPSTKPDGAPVAVKEPAFPPSPMAEGEVAGPGGNFEDSDGDLGMGQAPGLAPPSTNQPSGPNQPYGSNQPSTQPLNQPPSVEPKPAA